MKVYLAHTSPINPPSTTPKLTRAQVWEGLKLKARNPLPYVPMFERCEVVEEHAEGLTRIVEFKQGGPPGKITEVITFSGDVRADFHMVDLGTFISNIISTGEGDESDLYLTFTFAWNFPDIQEGSSEAQARAAAMAGSAKEAVTHTLKQIRELAQKGELKA